MVLLELNTVAGGRRRWEDVMIDGAARVREAEEDDEDDVEELGDPGSGSRGETLPESWDLLRRKTTPRRCWLRRARAQLGWSWRWRWQGVGNLPRRREEAEEGKTERGGNPRVGAGLYRRKGAAPAVKSTGLPTWMRWMSCRTVQGEDDEQRRCWWAWLG